MLINRSKIIMAALIFSALSVLLFCNISFAEDKVVIGSDENKTQDSKAGTKSAGAAENNTPVVIGGDKAKIEEPKNAREAGESKAEEKNTGEVKAVKEEKTEKETRETEPGSEAGKEAVKTPAPPTALTAASIGGKVKLNWNEIAGIHHYNIYRDSADKITKKASKYNTNQNEFEDEDVRQGETYYYFVTSAVKSKDDKVKYIESEPAGPIKIETEDKTPPAAVESLKADYAENGKVRLSWVRPTGANFAQYIVLKGESNEASALKEIKTLAGESFEESGLDDEKNYFYAVISVSKSGVKSASSSIIGVKTKDTLAPEAPSNIVAAPFAGKVELGWQRPKSADIAYYSIYKSESGETGFKKISSPVLLTEEHFTDKSVKGGREYYYRITASDKSANESKMSEPAVRVKIKMPMNISFARSGEKSYYGFSFNPQSRSLYFTESADGKTWSWWSMIIQNFPLPDDYSDACRIAFLKDGKKIMAFIYDTEKMSIDRAVSVDGGVNWKWWETFSSSLPLPDGFDENTRITFSVKGNLIYCICFNVEAKTLSAASTADGQSWKWWKKYGENLSGLPNQSVNSQNSACFYNNQFEAFSYNLDDKTLYKGTLPSDKNNYSSWNEVSAKFPAPPQ